MKQPNRKTQLEAFERLLDVMDTLREKCPWDKKQTFDSLRCNTIEETYELTEAIERHDLANIRKELGDVLLHIVFYSRMAAEQDAFDIEDVCNSLCDKLIFRHPHIYGDVKADTSEAVLQNWEAIKLKEKEGNKSVLAGVPATLPALIKAYRIQDKARNVGFDWENAEQAWDKVEEEIREFRAEVMAQNSNGQEAEFGDLIFALINVARLMGINPENALERTNKKFIRRFNYLEQKVREQGGDLKAMSLEEMDAIWNEAKKSETSN